MGKLLKEIPLLEKEDTLSLAMTMLYFISKDNHYETTGKLSLLLDQRSFLNFIKYYGGKTIKVPTLEQLSEMIKYVLIYQYHYIESLEWDESIKQSGLILKSPDEKEKVIKKIEGFDMYLRKYNYDIKEGKK